MDARSERERKAAFGARYEAALAYAGKSGRAQATDMGISTQTELNWRKGRSFPYIWDDFRYFSLVGVNPLYYALSFCYPEVARIGADAAVEDLRRALDIFWRATTEEEVRIYHHMAVQMHRIWVSALRIGTVDCHLPMDYRVASTDMVIALHAAAQQAGTLDCGCEIRPDVDGVRHAVDSGRASVLIGNHGYVATSCTKKGYAGKIGPWIVGCRKRRGVSQEDLADALHIHTVTERSWENEQSYPSYYELVEIARQLDMDVFASIYGGIIYPHAVNDDCEIRMSPQRKDVLDSIARADEEEVRETAFLILGQHGGSWHNMLHKFLMFSELQPLQRADVGAIVLNQYSMAQVHGRTVCNQNILPDLDTVRQDIEAWRTGV